MKFHRINAVHTESECGRYIIQRFSRGANGAYQAIRLGKPWAPGRDGKPKGWDNSASLSVDQFTGGDEESRLAAFRACVRACEMDAAEVVA